MAYDPKNIDAELAKCDLSFKEQCKIVAEGMKKGFTYDGCTAVPDFNFGYDCCGEHDTYYQSQEITKAEADKKLYDCILKKGIPFKILGIPCNSNVLLASTFWLGLKLGGWVVWNKRAEQKKAQSRIGENVELKVTLKELSDAEIRDYSKL